MDILTGSTKNNISSAPISKKKIRESFQFKKAKTIKNRVLNACVHMTSFIIRL